ncbi:MafI family immunity protein [Lentzea sp. NBRC 102530]|uniref:MafI family immunity protein n=1 Tax=Lentzea sp. NBRC 102530 TaxID=3032201 RepID=UPI0024A03255|nr:MafI family immunity protein [Lentzea sp. NBRC 102530]GLY52451.1 hypothetical protein Lesp01_61070 [Lentzea sp. NBRC 102530]
MDSRQLHAAVLSLLAESPVTRDEVRADVQELVAAGEVELAFDTMCSWIFDDQLEIEHDHHVRLVALGEALGDTTSAPRLSELVRNHV